MDEPINPADLSGSFTLPREFRPGLRTERVPFPCHPRRHYAFLNEFDPDVPVQYWEQACAADWQCGRLYRFEHRHRGISWHPIESLTDPLNAPAKPLDAIKVIARIMSERQSA